MSIFSTVTTNSALSKAKSYLSGDFTLSQKLDELVKNVNIPADEISIDGFKFDVYEPIKISNTINVTTSPTSARSFVVEHTNKGLQQISLGGWVFKTKINGSKFDTLTSNITSRLKQINGYLPKYTAQAQTFFNSAVTQANQIRSLVDSTIQSAKGFYNEINSLFNNNTTIERHVDITNKAQALIGKLVTVKAGGNIYESFVIQSFDIEIDGKPPFDAFRVDIKLIEFVKVKELKSTVIQNSGGRKLDKKLTAQTSEVVTKTSDGLLKSRLFTYGGKIL